jgi:hypothetical protein
VTIARDGAHRPGIFTASRTISRCTGRTSLDEQQPRLRRCDALEFRWCAGGRPGGRHLRVHDTPCRA